MGDLTPHFSTWEFVDKSNGTLVGPSPALLGCLEHIRGEIGVPLPIISGYRSPEHNEAVGGASDSRHLHGDAADLPYGLVTVDAAARGGAIGIGACDGYAVHVDMRPGDPIVFEDC